MVFRNGQFYSALQNYLVNYLTWCKIQITATTALFFLLPNRGYSNKCLQDVLNSRRLCCSELEEFFAETGKYLCPLGAPFCIISDKFHSLGLQHCAVVSGLALGKCSWKFVFEQLWRPSVNVSWLVQSSSESFSVNPVSLWLNETPVYCQRCCWEPVTALCCSVPVEPGCWALVPNYKPHRSKPSLRSSLLIYFT